MKYSDVATKVFYKNGIIFRNQDRAGKWDKFNNGLANSPKKDDERDAISWYVMRQEMQNATAHFAEMEY